MATVSRLTKRTVDSAAPTAKRYTIWDSSLAGFGLSVAPSGRKTFVVRYRPRGVSRPAPKRFMQIGRYGPMAPDEARRTATQVLAAVGRGDDPARGRKEAMSGMTVEECAAAFLAEHVLPKRKAGTTSTYRCHLEYHVLPRIGSRIVASLTRRDLSDLHRAMQEVPAAANRTLAVLSSMFSWAERHGIVPDGHNPARKVVRFRSAARTRFLTREEVGRLAETLQVAETVGLPYEVDESRPTAKHAPKPENRRVVFGRDVTSAIGLLLLTGCRLREILHMRWEDVDFDRGLFAAPDSKTGPKTVLLSQTAIKVLSSIPRISPYVFPGQSLTTARTDLKKPWAAIRRHADIEDVRIHDLRHSFASVGVSVGLSLPIIGKLLGHTQPGSTSRYAHLGDQPLRTALELITAGLELKEVQPLSEQSRGRVRCEAGEDVGFGVHDPAD